MVFSSHLLMAIKQEAAPKKNNQAKPNYFTQ
jgi:hypothetical protein